MTGEWMSGVRGCGVCVKARGVWLDIQLVDGVDLDVRWRGVDTHVIYSLDVVNKGSRFTRLILLIYHDQREAEFANIPSPFATGGHVEEHDEEGKEKEVRGNDG